MKNKLILIPVALMLGAVSSQADNKSGSTQVCVFDAIGSGPSRAASDMKHLKSSNVSVQEYFNDKKDSDLEHSFESFVQAQVDSGRHCDGLAITGYYGDNLSVYGGDNASKPLRLNLVQKLLSQPKNQAWASAVKAVYFDGALPTTAQGTLGGSFPNAQFLGCSQHTPRDGMPNERPIRAQLAQAFVKASAGGDIGTEQMQLSQECAQLTGPGEPHDTPQSSSTADKQDDPSVQPGAAAQPQAPVETGVTLAPKP